MESVFYYARTTKGGKTIIEETTMDPYMMNSDYLLFDTIEDCINYWNENGVEIAMEKEKMTVEEYARKILLDAGCDEYTYGGEFSKDVLSDLKEAFPDGMKFPYVDVANAILAISKPRPIERKPWRMVWDSENDCDGMDCDSFGAAKIYAEDTLVEWMVEERNEWKDFFNPTDDELDNYNYMICNCCVWVSKYNPDTDEYDEVWSLSYEDEKNIGWYELTREMIEKEKEEYYAGISENKQNQGAKTNDQN